MLLTKLPRLLGKERNLKRKLKHPVLSVLTLSKLVALLLETSVTKMEREAGGKRKENENVC